MERMSYQPVTESMVTEKGGSEEKMRFKKLYQQAQLEKMKRAQNEREREAREVAGCTFEPNLHRRSLSTA